MKLRLDYGTDGLDVELPEERVTVIEPISRPAAADPHATLLEAIRNPIDSAPLRERARPGKRIAISVCDITRAQPRQLQIAALLAEMPGVVTRTSPFSSPPAPTGRNTPAELERMLGSELVRRCRVVNHDARDASSLRHIGTTTSGVPVYLNREWLDADVRITTGFVEPHFFAGFSGGPKMVAPGLAGIQTVMILHDAPRIAHPLATWGVTEGNPIQTDVREIARMIPVDFTLDVTLNRDQKITAAFAGDILAQHQRACAYAKGTVMRAVPAPFDVVLTTNSGYPLDQNLYQAVKGMSAAATIVKPAGTIVCAAECRDGLPESRELRRGARITAGSGAPAADDYRTRLFGARSVASADTGANPAESPGARQDKGSRPGRGACGALRANRGCHERRARRADTCRFTRHAVRAATGSSNHPVSGVGVAHARTSAQRTQRIVSIPR
jgi:nickel-dependent lactate racemase